MLMIRLQRVGRKNQPYFRFVLTESQNSTKSGKFHEVLGFFDFRKGGKHTINAEKVKQWISRGAQVSDTVYNYLVTEKIIQGKKRNVLPRKSPVKLKSAETEKKETKIEAVAEIVKESSEPKEEQKAETTEVKRS